MRGAIYMDGDDSVEESVARVCAIATAQGGKILN